MLCYLLYRSTFTAGSPQLTAVCQDGLGAFISAETLSAAEQTQRHGSATVMHTFLVMMSLDKIPGIVAVAGRKKMAAELKAQVGSSLFKTGSKQKTIAKTVVIRINELADGKAFERVDFEELKKKQDAESIPIADA